MITRPGIHNVNVVFARSAQCSDVMFTVVMMCAMFVMIVMAMMTRPDNIIAVN